jgi:hypothetical protein
MLPPHKYDLAHSQQSNTSSKGRKYKNKLKGEAIYRGEIVKNKDELICHL